jgi:hypothetical protein
MDNSKPQLNERASNAIYDALSDVVQDGRTKVEAVISKNGTPEFVSFFGDIATGYFSRLVLACLKRILNIEDTLSRLDRLVSKLVAAPFNTATAQLAIALQLDSGSGSSAPNEHIIERYRNALVSFDMARSLADTNEIIIIDLCSGLICTRLPGAKTEAVLHLQSYLTDGQKLLADCREEIGRQQTEMRKAKNYLSANPWWTFPGMKAGFVKGSIYWAEKKLPALEKHYKQLHISLNIVQGLVCNLDPSVKAKAFF